MALKYLVAKGLNPQDADEAVLVAYVEGSPPTLLWAASAHDRKPVSLDPTAVTSFLRRLGHGDERDRNERVAVELREQMTARAIATIAEVAR
jgi:hypothetical protein